MAAGESKQKHAILLEVLHNHWRTIKLPLTSVRPFIWDTLALAAAQPPLDPEDSAAITTHLERKVSSRQVGVPCDGSKCSSKLSGWQLFHYKM